MQTSLRKSLTVRTAAAFGLVLGLAVGSTAVRADEAGVSDDTIKIGMFGPLTGVAAFYGYPINNGAIAVYKQVNDAGGIHGRKIEIVHEDGACDPAKTRAAVKKLISRDEVFMVHGGTCSPPAFATRDLFIEEKVPVVMMAATLDKITKPVSPYIFTTIPTGGDDGRSIIRFVLSNPKIKRLGIIAHNDDWAHAKLGEINAEIKKSTVELVAHEIMDRNATDATTQVLKLKDANPDAILFLTYPGESAVFLREARKHGLTGPFIGANAVMDLHDLAKRAGGAEAIENVYAAAYLKDSVDSEAMKPYVDLMKKYFPNDRIQSSNFYGMQGAFTIVDALTRAGKDLTRASLLKALEETKDFPGRTSYCSVTFKSDDHNGCSTEQFWTFKNGEIKPVGETWPTASN